MQIHFSTSCDAHALFTQISPTWLPPKTEGPNCRCRGYVGMGWVFNIHICATDRGIGLPGQELQLLKGAQSSAQMWNPNFTWMAVGMVMGMGMWMGMGRAPSMLTASSQNNSRMTCSRMSHLSRRFCGAAVPRTKLGYSEARKKNAEIL